METKRKQIKHHHSGLVLGILLVLLGGILIFVNSDILPKEINRIVISWQMILIFIGIFSFRKHLLPRICVVFTGIFFMIPKLAKEFPDTFSFVGDNFVSAYWPVFLILAGIIVIYRLSAQRCYEKRRLCGKDGTFNCKGSRNFHHQRHRRHYFTDRKPYEINEDFSKVNVFGYGEYIVIDTEFKGGSLTAVFGGIELDLRKAFMPEGDTYLEIEAVFSGITLFLPDNWMVVPQIETVFGGIDDHRYTGAVDSSRRLIIVGSGVFSGIDFKN
ncbi:MAG: cell wall-active antibiotics response protein [Prevotellaceae bacterium]|jgi:predicted membrane protein|nr:cell wall-active antibiotics response protein [Prevotellaceae bacterium]